MTYTVRDSITPSASATEAILLGLPVIYCEGIHDEKFLKRYLALPPEKYSLRSVSGKPKLLEILKSKSSVPRIGLADADFDHVLGLNKNIVELHLSDHHDIEVDLILSDTFRSNVQYLYDYDLKKRIQDIYEKCFNLSLLRYVNSKEDLRLCFNDLKFRDWDGKTIEELAQKLLSFKNNKAFHGNQGNINLVKAAQKYENRAKKLCPKQFHNGKDLFSSIHHDLQEHLKSSTQKPKPRLPHTKEDLKKEAIIAFTNEDFQRMSFFKGLKNFAESHKLNIFKSQYT